LDNGITVRFGQTIVIISFENNQEHE